MNIVVKADATPAEMLGVFSGWLEREAAQQAVLAGHTTGRGKKDREAMSNYAAQCARFWKSVEIEQ